MVGTALTVINTSAMRRLEILNILFISWSIGYGISRVALQERETFPSGKPSLRNAIVNVNDRFLFPEKDRV